MGQMLPLLGGGKNDIQENSDIKEKPGRPRVSVPVEREAERHGYSVPDCSFLQSRGRTTTHGRGRYSCMLETLLRLKKDGES